jgi:glyoxylase-like metal-dependent hydrolase (beta-lactamase superfamily II)
MELYEGAHQIGSLFGGRHLFQYYFAGERTVLVDSGVATTPEATIFPYIERLGKDPSKLNWLITTHPDADHQGGNAAVKSLARQIIVACGEADRNLVQDPACLYAERYNYLRHDHGLGFEEEPIPAAGHKCGVDLGLRGGEIISISDNWELEVLHVPGHSLGHLALLDRPRRTAFVSDAVHGRGCPKTDGNMALPVTYFHIDSYLSTLRHLEQLDLQALHTGHWPSMYGDEIRDFMSDSRRTVEVLDRRLLRALQNSSTGLTLNQLIDEARAEFPDWPSDTRDLAMFPVKGHLELLEARGKIRMTGSGRPLRWERA